MFVGTQLIFKNNSVNFKGYRFNIYGTNITIENNHFTSSYDAYQGNEGVLYLQNCNNVFIRYNAFDSEQAILGLSECELINFGSNSIEINGKYVVFLKIPQILVK